MLPDTLPVKVPTHDRIGSTVRHRREFYLVGEAERSMRRPPAITDGRTSISINGRWHAMRGRTATFEQLLRIAFPAQALYNPNSQRAGTGDDLSIALPGV